ncbi:hypothetical protein H4R33_007088 [Dimargaris cristalligena]|nr:hypothetical protein H4R33_007088 [Dimargaris cristalligena]
MPQELTNNIINTNLLGTISVTQHLLKPLLQGRQGCIINMSSIVGLEGNLGQSVYAASKAGVIGFTKALAKELGSRQVRVNCIAPGFVETDMTQDLLKRNRDLYKQRVALGRIGTVEDIAQTALYLATANYVTGQVLTVDGCTSL